MEVHYNTLYFIVVVVPFAFDSHQLIGEIPMTLNFYVTMPKTTWMLVKRAANDKICA